MTFETIFANVCFFFGTIFIIIGGLGLIKPLNTAKANNQYVDGGTTITRFCASLLDGAMCLIISIGVITNNEFYTSYGIPEIAIIIVAFLMLFTAIYRAIFVEYAERKNKLGIITNATMAVLLLIVIIWTLL